MVDGAFLARMKPNSILVNCGRGDLVDNQALRKALIDGTIRGAALDTIFPEPTPGDHPLVDLPPEVRDRVVYSSHLGGSSGGAFAKAHLTMWTNARHILNGERPTNVVNGLLEGGRHYDPGSPSGGSGPGDADLAGRQPGSPLLSS